MPPGGGEGAAWTCTPGPLGVRHSPGPYELGSHSLPLVEEGAVRSCRTAPRRVRGGEGSRRGKLAAPRCPNERRAPTQPGAVQYELLTPDASAWLRSMPGAEGAQLPTGAGRH